MEPRARAAQALRGSASEEGTVWRFRARLVAACTVLLGVAMTQSPGLLVPDTKLDLALAPVDFLSRAAHLWDAEGAFGQLQNQAYGYLWPMGPFFVVGDALDVPGWVVQRLWVALVMCVALTGAAALSKALGVRSDLAAIAAGFAYALSPRMLTVLGPISIEAWPSALAPWVLLPLVVGATRGSPRRAAAFAALGVAMIGGVNAAATSAVLPLGVVWLLTREPGARRRSLMLWWPVFTVMASLWWLVPLFVMGSYSPPFLDYIESAANTTFPTTLFDALRGTSNWVPYVDSGSRAGNDLIRQFFLPMNSAVVLAAGLVGLSLRRNPHRVFLLTGLVVGLFLVTMGHLGSVQGWFAPQLREFLDGALAPVRNVHKFDPVIRLPLVVGLAHLLDELQARLVAGNTQRPSVLAASERTSMRLLTGVVLLGVVGASLPAATGRISPAGGFSDVPDYWREAAAWLASEQDEGVALLLPGSSFGTYVWGSPKDEPMQALAEKPWAVRNAVPLAPPGNIRMLDEIERRLSQGRGSRGLAAYLRRAGVSHVVVRNDLVRTSDIPDPVLVHQALDDSNGLLPAATFGPDIGGSAEIEGELGKAMVNGGWQSEYPAIEIYSVSYRPPYATGSSRSTPTVVGGPEDLLDLSDLGVIGDEPVRLGTDVAEDEGVDGLVLTDGLRAVERNFGRLHDGTSETLTRNEERRLPSRVSDYSLHEGYRWSTVAAVDGVASVDAASSQSDASAYGVVEPGLLPYAAIDGSRETAWVSGAFQQEPQWWQVDLQQPRALGRVTITAGSTGTELLRVSTQDWSSEPIKFTEEETRDVNVPGKAAWLRVEDVSDRPANRLSIAEIDLGLRATRRLDLPDVPRRWGDPDVVVLRRLGDQRNGCATVDGQVRCSSRKSVAAEEPLGFARRFTLHGSADYAADLQVRPRPGSALDALILRDQPVSVAASSVDVSDVRAGALAAVDGDGTTTWTAAPGDVRPQLRVKWLGRRVITGLGMSVAYETAARLPESVELSWPGGKRTVELRNGSARFPAIRTTELTIKVIEAEPATDLSFAGSATSVPVGITELRVQGLPYLPVVNSTDLVTTDCGVGPDVRLNARTWATRVTASPADLAAGRPLSAQLCGGGVVGAWSGANDVVVSASAAFLPDSLVLGSLPSGDAGLTALTATLPDAVNRRLEVPRDDLSVATRENVNRGWEVDASGGDVAPQVFDGWRQGWSTKDAQTLRVRFAPDAQYRTGLLVGALALLLLLGFSAWRGRRTQPPVGPGRARFPAWLLLPLVGGVLAGTAGAVVAGIGFGAGLLARRLVTEGAHAWLASPLVLAAGAYVVRPWGSSEGWAGQLAWPQLCVVLAVSATAAWVAADSSRRQRSGRRIAGLSTTR